VHEWMLALVGVERVKHGVYTLPEPLQDPNPELPADRSRDWQPLWRKPPSHDYNAAYLKHVQTSILAYEADLAEGEVSNK
jgi:hypothetical protein